MSVRSDGPWRIGVLFSSTGVTAGVETAQLRATLLAVDEINAAGGVLGRSVEAVVRDPGSDPKRFRALAEQLLTRDGVRLIFGCYMSSARKLVLPVVEQHHGLLFYPTLYEGFEFSASCIYTGAAPNQNALQLARYLLDTGRRRLLLIGSNYVYPYESNRIMTDLVTGAGGTVVDEIYVPVDATARHFERAVQRMRDTAPDAVFSTVVGAPTTLLYRAHRDAGFDPAAMPIASLTTGEAEVADMGAASAEGHITAAPFFETLTSPAAQAFVSAFKARHGAEAPVPAAAEAAYLQVHVAADALLRAGSDDPQALLPQLRDRDFPAPQGRIRISGENNHTHLWPRVAKVDAAGRFRVVWDPGVRVKPDPYCVVQTLNDWSADALPAT
ncbi:transporter substrate-binding domain-containing protein [Terrihabitans rhizophilus]|uniref:Transporter substrate-binding domain-containing protein n=1 Tax=Terrihabitans rhizophilus TaxID=3092662 RepID=A0ABU4RP41_9HYPH|nr:transporter substrate-binding domain-containing protein [Terrihabitans sp. PJ23]MDX6805963.1 transporter substrate-binding domain-containing protein [Terrihabitans sp. PJ23]